MIHRRTRRPFIILVAGAVLGLLAVACGGGDSEGAASPTSTSSDGGAAANAGATEAATEEAMPTEEPTPEIQWPEIGTAEVITDDLNVRIGPGLEFLVLGRLQPGDEVPVSGRAEVGRWLALPGIGWVTYDETWVELPEPVDELPQISMEEAGFEFVSPLHPLDAIADIPVVDTVAEAVIEGDRARLLGLAAPPAVGEDGEDDDSDGGTEPEFAPTSGCQDSVMPAAELEEHVDEFLGDGDAQLHLYAVIGTPQTDDVDATFSPVFAFEQGGARQLWLGPEGGIEWFSLGCGEGTPGELLRTEQGGDLFFWLRPVVPEPLDPVG